MLTVAWMKRAACHGMDIRVFYAENQHAREQVATAKRICATCPVIGQCRNWAIQSGERFGVWGGLSQQELRQQRRRFSSRWEQRTDTPKKPQPRKQRKRAKCGSRSGYQKHLRERTQICAPCRQANTDADNRLVRTGTSKVLAP